MKLSILLQILVGLFQNNNNNNNNNYKGKHAIYFDCGQFSGKFTHV